MYFLRAFGRYGVRRLVVVSALSLLGACAFTASASATAANVTVTLNQPGLGTEFSPQVINAHPGDTINWAPQPGSTGGVLVWTSVNCATGPAYAPAGVGQVPLPSGNGGGSWLIPAGAAPGTYYFFDGNGGNCSPGSFGSPGTLNPSEGELVLTPASTGGGSPNPPASLTATVSVASQFKSVTLSANSETFGNCTGGSSNGSTLGFPNGSCSTPSFNVTNNGSVPESIDTQATNATPSDNGTAWTLMGAGTPGANQYQLKNNNGQLLSSAAAQDNVAGTMQPGATVGEILSLTGPSSSSDPSGTFTTSATWTAF